MANNLIISESFSSSVELLHAFQSEMYQMYQCLFETSRNIKKERKRLRSMLPYHINVIDELHINENAHSRILTKLLQFRDAEGRYVILDTLLEYIKRRSTAGEFENLSFISPSITQEKGRIDLWIQDSKSKNALIIENKIYNAPEQRKQLYRYIERTRQCGYKNSNIYILYITQEGYDPSSQSWGDDNTYRCFQSRYMALSYRDDIMYWLKFFVLPNLNQNDKYLLSAITQYVDFLEGLFGVRQIEKSLNMNLQKFISEKLGLSSEKDPNERYQSIEEAIIDIDRLKNSLIDMREQAFQDQLKYYSDKWKSDYKRPSSKFQICDDYSEYEETYLFGVKFICDEKPTHVVIGYDEREDGLYCQVLRDISNRSKKLTRKTSSIYSLIKELLNQETDDNIYIYQYFSRDFQAVYERFCKVVKAINKEI